MLKRRPGPVSRRRLCQVLIFAATLALVWLASLLLHEVGHGLTAQILGGQFARLHVILTYVTLPEFLGLPHYLFLGGSKPEPVDNAELLGCPRWAFITAVVLISAAMTWGLIAYLEHTRKPSHDRRQGNGS
jgi:hypothetical protein